jgi:hypothetical protein
MEVISAWAAALAELLVVLLVELAVVLVPVALAVVFVLEEVTLVTIL